MDGKLGLLILQGFGRVDDSGLRARLRRDQLGAHVDPLLQRRNQVLLGRDGSLQHVALGGLLRLLGVERSNRRGKLAEVRRQHALLAREQTGVHIGGPRDGWGRGERAGVGSRERCTAAQAFGLGGFQVGAGRPHVGLSGRPIELHENIARLHERAVGGVDGDHPAGLDRLDHFHPAGRLKLALGGGDDVDAPEIGEAKADDDERADDPEEGHANGRRGRFQDLEDGRKEFPVG